MQTLTRNRSTLPPLAEVERAVPLLMAQVRARPARQRAARIEALAESAGEKGLPLAADESGAPDDRTAPLPPIGVAALYEALLMLLEWECLEPYEEDVQEVLKIVNWGARP